MGSAMICTPPNIS